jgi:hypothetical protein
VDASQRKVSRRVFVVPMRWYFGGELGKKTAKFR